MAFQTGSYNLITKNVPITPKVYTPAPDWVSITGAVTNQVIFLVNDATNGQYTIRTQFTRPASENIYINWGDGTTDTVSTTTATSTSHTYTSGGTACSRGYNTWKITISGDSGTRITEARFVQLSTEFSEYPSGLLQAWYGDNTVTTMASYFNEQGTPTPPQFTYLEYVRCPEGMTSSTALDRAFFLCRQLQKVDLPTSLSFLGGTALEQTFYECNSLFEISDFPANMTGITSFDQTFFRCFSLERIIFLASELPNINTMNRTFQECLSLGELALPSIPNNTNWGLTFVSCRSLRFINIPIIKNGVTHTFSSCFSNCFRLQSVNLDPNTTGTMIIDQMFNACSSITTVTLPPNANVTTYSATFNGCSNLKTVSLPMNATNVTTFSSCFNACLNLQSITLPTTAPSTNVSFATAFQNCYNLDEVIFPSTYQINNLSSTFTNASLIKNISLPNNAQNTLTTMNAMCNNCYSLETITMPTQMTGNTTLTSAFQNCTSLKSCILPSSLPAVTTMSNMFNTCSSLQTVTMPTSAALLGSNSSIAYTNLFAQCYSLKEVVMPTTVSNTQSAGLVTTGMFLNCYSLKSVSLPTGGWSSSLTTATNTFANCYALTGITNIEYYGNSGTTTTNYVGATTWGTGSRNILSLDFYCKFSKLELQGTGTGVNLSKLNSLRLRNGGSGQYGGTSPQIDISYTNLSQAALVQVFNDLPTVTAKTINITSATGAAALTAGERAIATGKGWTITG